MQVDDLTVLISGFFMVSVIIFTRTEDLSEKKPSAGNAGWISLHRLTFVCAGSVTARRRP